MRKGKRLQKHIFTMIMALLLMVSSLPVTGMEVKAATDEVENEMVLQETEVSEGAEVEPEGAEVAEAAEVESEGAKPGGIESEETELTEPVTVSGCNYDTTDTGTTDSEIEAIDTETTDAESSLDIQYEVTSIKKASAYVKVTISGYDETVENFGVAVEYDNGISKKGYEDTFSYSPVSGTTFTKQIGLSDLLGSHEYTVNVKVYEGTSCEESSLLDTETLTFTTAESTIDSSKIVLEAVQDENVFNKVTIKATYDDETTDIMTVCDGEGAWFYYRKKGDDSFVKFATMGQVSNYYYEELSDLVEGDVYEIAFRAGGVQKVLEYTVTNTTFTYTVDAFVQPQSIVFTMDLYGDNLSAYTNTYMYGSAYYKDENGEWVKEGGALSYTASSATSSNPKTLTRSAGCTPGEKYEYKFVLSVAAKTGGNTVLSEKYFTGICPEYPLTITAEGFIDYANLYYTFAKEDWMGDAFTKTTADIYYKKSSEPESAWVKNSSRTYVVDKTDASCGSISGLEANTSYDVKLVSDDYVITQISFTTKEDTRSLNPNITDMTYTECDIQVLCENMENSDIVYIYPYYREKGAEEWLLHSDIEYVSSTVTSKDYTFSDLKEGTEYEYAFQLKPASSSNTVKDEEMILEAVGTFKTKAREDLKVTVEADTTADTADFKIYLNEACIGYDIMFYVKLAGEEEWSHYKKWTMYGTSSANPYKELTIDWLMADTEYEYAVEVKAQGDSTVFGEGNIYNVTTGSFRTQKYDANLEITTKDITDTSFTLTFTIPDAKEGVLYGADYYVYADNP